MGFLDTLEKYKAEYGYEFYGYCLMDNHEHLLIKTAGEAHCTIKRNAQWYLVWTPKSRQKGDA